MLFMGINSLIFWISMSCENAAGKYQLKLSGHVPHMSIRCSNFSDDMGHYMHPRKTSFFGYQQCMIAKLHVVDIDIGP